MDAEGTFSSGELAKLLKAPVILSVDVTKTTRTAAAMVLGCQALDPEVNLAGVILSRTAGSRHESVLRQAMEGITGVPVLGAIPRLPEDIFPERHLGLVPPQESEEIEGPLVRVAEVAERYLDLDRILEVAGTADPLEIPQDDRNVRRPLSGEDDTMAGRPRIGVFKDSAFQFYYPENLEALETAGAEVVMISAMEAPSLPEVDGLYLGGGFPETTAPELSGNETFLASVRERALDGLPIYAECGGAVYLGERLHYQGKTFRMAGVLPVEFGFHQKPRGHGYAILETVAENPFFPVGETVKGHEFHYTALSAPEPDDLEFAFRVQRGTGFGGGRDGLMRKNVLASYTHIHALGMEGWASSMVRAAARFRST
jgi:cobyrinic acid a,c-diamide synthase